MTLPEVQDEVSQHLDDIKRLFKPGAKVMVFVGFPPDPHGLKDFVMGDNDLQEIMNMCARRMAAARSA